MNDGRLWTAGALAMLVVGVELRARSTGSNGVVRRGKKPPTTLAETQIRWRVSAALARLRDKDADSVRDALALLSFTNDTPANKYDPTYEAISEEQAAAAWPRVFPHRTDRELIDRAAHVLVEEGLHRIDEAINNLRIALNLDENFEDNAP